MQAVFYRIWSYMRHRVTAWNTTGEGIHSPHLFYLVRMILRDTNDYYCFEAIESRRRLLMENRTELDVVDYGSCGSPEGLHVRRRVCDIAARQLESPHIQQLLFRMAVFLGRELHRPLNILELGTSLGIGTAYLASADSGNRVITLEGSEAVARQAEEQWRALRLQNIDCRIGRIDDTLYNTHARVDIAYVDANHTYEATKRYADYLLPLMDEKGIIVIDDIHYSPEMGRAWRELKADARVTSSMDLYDIGLLFVDKHYLKRNYILNI